jgi:hypothetical protein
LTGRKSDRKSVHVLAITRCSLAQHLDIFAIEENSNDDKEIIRLADCS